MVPIVYSLLLRHYATLSGKYLNVLEGIRCSALWHRVSGLAAFHLSMGHCAFIFRSQGVQKDASEAPMWATSLANVLNSTGRPNSIKSLPGSRVRSFKWTNVSKTDSAAVIRVNIRTVTTDVKPVHIMLACLNILTRLSGKHSFLWRVTEG